MRQLARTMVLGAAAALWASLAALAGSYTVHLEGGGSLETRYPPRFSAHEVELLTRAGNWITVPRNLVRQVSNEAPHGRQARMIDTHTIAIGWAPNDAPHPRPAEAPAASEPAEPVVLLLAALEMRPGRPEQDFSVAQFVDPEGMSGGIPAAGVFYYNVLEDEPLEILQTLPPGPRRAILGLPAEGNLIEILQGLPPGGLQAIQGVPPGGLRAIQGLPPGFPQVAAPPAPSASAPPGE